MIPVFMKKNDDCWRSCLASLLEMDYDDVPEFPEKDSPEDGVFWFKKTQEFLSQFGLGYIEVYLSESFSKELVCRGYHVILGDSKLLPGYKHATVGKDGEIVHDPNPKEGAGIVPGTEYYGFFVSLDPKISEYRTG